MSITVGELIEQLQKYDPATPVLASKDDEGNGYRRMSGTDPVLVLKQDNENYEIESIFDNVEKIREYFDGDDDVDEKVESSFDYILIY